MPTAVKPGWPVAGIRAAVVHRRADGDAGRHLVVEQAADPRPQQRRELRVERVVGAARVGVDAAGQVAFERLDERAELVRVARDDEERRVAEGLGLQLLRRAPGTRRPRRAAACCRSGSPASRGAPARDQAARRPPAAWRRSRPASARRPRRAAASGAAALNRARTPATNCSVASPATSRTRPGFVQNWPVPIRQLATNSSTSVAPRSASAPGRITTGLTLDSSR